MNDAVEDLKDVLAFARERKAGLEIEARVLADLANAYRLRGNIDDAYRTATEAIDVARSRCARVPECLGHIVRAYVLCDAAENPDQTEGELVKAQALIGETGAIIYAPLIRDLNARLRAKYAPRNPTRETAR